MNNITFYSKRNEPKGERGYTEHDIRTGELWLYADATCPNCDKVQTVSNLFNGCCIGCGEKCL